MASQMILSANLKTLRLTGLRPTPNTKTKLLNFTTPKVKLKIRIYHENLVCLSQAMMVGRISELTSSIWKLKKQHFKNGKKYIVK